MAIDWVRRICLSFPQATEQVQWGNDLVFKVGGRMFCVAGLEPGEYCMSFKCSPEKYAELIELEQFAPAPYLARASWVAVRSADALPVAEMRALLRESFDLVSAKLPKGRKKKSAPPAAAAKKRR
jgi:predicted DNA-binding protein (MmcQ/YjbR family)